MKITFMGAGSTVFVKNIIGDCMHSELLRDAEIALYDIDAQRLDESYIILQALNENINENRMTIKKYMGVEQRKDALRNATFAVNAIQVGGYEPCTKIDFDIPKKYGVNQTIADTLGIGGIMRGLRTIPIMADFARDMEEVCPDVYFLNYTNPMAILTGFMLRYTKIKTVGLCHSVQTCSRDLLKSLGMEDKVEGRTELIAGINHMGWLLKIHDKDGNDLYPEIKKRALKKNEEEKHWDMVRYEYIRRLGYYCTESSEHNAEYNPFFIKNNYPELIEKFNIPLDEYPRRCEGQIQSWANQKEAILQGGKPTHGKSEEYGSRIMEAIISDVPYKIGGNVINNGIIPNLPHDACVEVPCMVDASGINPCYVGELPLQLASMNITNILPQLLTIKAGLTKKKEDIYQAVMLDPLTASQLSLDDIVAMCDEMIDAHGEYMSMYK